MSSSSLKRARPNEASLDLAPLGKQTRREHVDDDALAPVPLIDIDDASMSVSERAKELLKRFGSSGRPLAIVCIVGRSRTGKSFLLNRGVLNRTSGFRVSSSIHACTKGLWLHGPPIPGRKFWTDIGVRCTEEDDAYDVLVVDTEGINALDRDESYDTRIFTLALLLSSCFVYNSLGAIDEAALSTLAAVATVAETLKKKNGRAADVALDLPSLLWVVRDFSLKIHEAGSTEAEVYHPPDDDAYLEEALRVEDGVAITPKIELRRVLKRNFPSRSCVTLVRPCESEEDIRRVCELSWDAMRPAFRDQIQVFRSKLFGSTRPKRVVGESVDAHLFLELLEKYVEAVNSGAIPVVHDTWSQVTRQRCEEGIREACRHLDERLRPFLPEGFGGVSSSSSNPLPPLPDPVEFYLHIVNGLRHADAIYHATVVPSLRATFDEMLYQQLMVRVMAAVDRWKRRAEQDDVPEDKWSGGDDVEDPVETLDAWARWLTRKAPSVSNLPAPTFSDVIRPPLEMAARSVLEDAIRGSLFVRRLPDLRTSLERIGASGKKAIDESILEETRARYEAMLAEGSAEMGRVQDMLREAEGRIAALENEIESRTTESKRLAEDLDVARREASEQSTESAEAQKARAELIEELQSQLDKTHEAMVAAKRAEAAVRAQSEREKKAWDAERLGLQQSLQTVVRERSLAQDEVASLRASVPKLQDKLEVSRDEVRRLIESQSAMRLDWATKLREVETEAARSSARAHVLETQCEGLRKRAEEAASLTQEVSKLRAEVRMLERRTEEMAARERKVIEGLSAMRDLQRTLRSAQFGV